MRNKFTSLAACCVALLALSGGGCTPAANSNRENSNSNINRETSASNTSDVSGSNNTNSVVAPGVTPDNNSAVPAGVTSPVVVTDNPSTPTASTSNRNKPLVPAPTPQIGSGANDFFLFTQARAAIDADDELKNTSIILDLHGGAVTLNGTVANDAQMKKAARLVQGIAGVKSVKNQLRISAGGRK